MATREFQDFQEGWSIMQEAIQKLTDNLEGISDQKFTSDDYMRYYTVVYELCKQDNSYEQLLYDKYKQIYQGYITSKVLPSLKEKQDEELVREVVQRWSNHKTMVYWLFRFFHFLDRYFVQKQKLPSLEEAGCVIFYEMVYWKMKAAIRDVLISMIDRERDEEKIDQSLVKNALDVYVEMGRGSTKHYEQDFESTMLAKTAEYYSRKASKWITVNSYADYMLKANACLEQEQHRANNYLHPSSGNKLLKIVNHEIVSMNASRLEEMKQNSGDNSKTSCQI